MARDNFDYDPELETQRSENVFSRVCTGYIGSIDTQNGVAIVDFEDFIGSRDSVDLTFDYISSVGPGWFRFMPCIGDKVLIGFTPANEAVILRYKSINYSQMSQFAADSNPPFVFRQLQSGEFEIMSSGYAEIWGSVTGKLHLAGGLASIDLDRQTSTITHSAATHQINSDQSSILLGTIRRNNPLTPNSDVAFLSPGISLREYAVNLFQNVAGVYSKLYAATFGRVMDYTPGAPQGVFTPRLSTQSGLPLSADVNIYTSTGVQQVRMQIDDLGNCQVDLPASAAQGFNLISAIGTYLFKALNIQIQAASQLTLSGALKVSISSGVQVDIEAPLVTVNGKSGNVLTNDTAISDFTGNFIQPGVPTFKSG